jgi:hypothetical protein
VAISRRGSYLVVSDLTSTLPNFCVKCGEPATKSFRKSFQWHHPAWFLLIFACLLLYAIVASFVSKRMQLGYSLCSRHAGRRVLLLILSAVALLGSIPLGYVIGSNAGIAVGAVGVLAGLIGLIVATNTLRIVKMTDRETEFTGAGDAFLRRLPGA